VFCIDKPASTASRAGEQLFETSPLNRVAFLEMTGQACKGAELPGIGPGDVRWRSGQVIHKRESVGWRRVKLSIECFWFDG